MTEMTAESLDSKASAFYDTDLKHDSCQNKTVTKHGKSR